MRTRAQWPTVQGLLRPYRQGAGIDAPWGLKRNGAARPEDLMPDHPMSAPRFHGIFVSRRAMPQNPETPANTSPAPTNADSK